MKKLTKEQAIIITGFTEVLCCEFSDFHQDVEKRLGRPVFTHQFPSLSEEIKEAYRDDFMSMLTAKNEGDGK